MMKYNQMKNNIKWHRDNFHIYHLEQLGLATLFCLHKRLIGLTHVNGFKYKTDTNGMHSP